MRFNIGDIVAYRRIEIKEIYPRDIGEVIGFRENDIEVNYWLETDKKIMFTNTRNLYLICNYKLPITFEYE